jgi:hypothetical protein
MVGDCTYRRREQQNMDAIIGRYKARMENTGLVLRHTAGISFDLTLEETLALYDFINGYRETLLTIQRETDPQMERVVLEKDDKE